MDSMTPLTDALRTALPRLTKALGAARDCKPGCELDVELRSAADAFRSTLDALEQTERRCTQINVDDSALPIIVAVVADGILEDVFSRRPVTVLHVDYDIDGADDDALHTIPRVYNTH